MRILILGGTNFIGPHLVTAARQRGHDLTLFNRGKTAPKEFSDIPQLRGDRETGDYAALAEGEWDVVIDTCAYWPRAVREALAALSGRVDHYVFVSTISVYAEFDADGYNEEAPLSSVEDPEAEEVTGETYGGLKVLCEQELEAFAGPVTVVRPGLVVGPRDPTDRFTYWPVRVARNDEVLAPGTPKDPMQFIDVRDLAEFTLRLVDDRTEGTFNVVTPAGAHTIGGVLAQCQAAASEPAELVWVSSDFLHEHKVAAWNDLPGWVPPGSPLAGIPQCSSERAVAAGLTFTDLAETVRDTLSWYLDEEREELSAGLAPEREAELIREWKNTSG